MHKHYKDSIDELGLEVTEHTNAMLAYWDKNLICRFANKAYIEWFGIDPEQMINKMHISQLLGPLFQKNLVYINAVLSGREQVFERSISTPSGETKNARATYMPDFVNGKVEGFYVHVADVSPLDPSAKSIADSIGRYTSSLEGTLTAVERTLRQSVLTEFPGIEYLAKKHYISESKLKRDFKERYKTTIFCYYRDLQMELAHQYISEKKCNKSQMALMLNFSNPSNFSTCYKKYLTELSVKQAVGKIKKESEERYKTFVEQVPFQIAMFDTHLNYMAASKMWVDDYRMGDKQFIGKNLYDLSPGVKEKFGDVLEGCLKGHIDKNDGALVERMNGAFAWMRWDIRPWYTIEQEIGGLIMMTEDLTPSKRLEEENKRLALILEKANEITRVGAWQRNFRTNTGFWSKILKEILEVPDDFDPVLSTAIEFYKEGSSRDLAKKVLKEAQDKGASFDIEVDMVTAKGKEKKVRVIGYPDFANGKCEMISGIFQDITHNTSIR